MEKKGKGNENKKMNIHNQILKAILFCSSKSDDLNNIISLFDSGYSSFYFCFMIFY